MHKSELEDLYSNHHKQKGRYGYLFCGGERGPYLKKWIGRGKKVLDLGCRDGMLTEWFFKENQVIGADIDQEALKRCKQRLSIETCWVDLNSEWIWERHAFDCIVACEILEHLFSLDKILQNIRGSLKPGGLFIGSVPNAFRFRNRIKFLFGKEYENDPTHVRQFSQEKLERLLDPFFSKVQVVPVGGKILPFWKVHEKRPFGKLFSKDLLWKADI